MFKRLLTVILAVIMLSALGAGCKQPAKKPIPTPTPAPKMVPKTVKPLPIPVKPGVTTMPTNSAEAHKLATKLAGEAAKVKGVIKATVALSNTTAYVGIDLESNIEANKTDTIKKEVADKVKNADKRLTNVYVTSDVDLVTRIKKVAEGTSKGKPVSSFISELSEIGRRIVPKTTK